MLLFCLFQRIHRSEADVELLLAKLLDHLREAIRDLDARNSLWGEVEPHDSAVDGVQAVQQIGLIALPIE